MKDQQHQKKLQVTLTELEWPDNVEELEQVNNRRWPSPCTPPTLEHQQYNKQQRITEPNIAMPEEVKQQEDKRKRETEKKIEREGDMIGRKTRQRGWGGRQWDKETETEWVKVVDEAAEVWWGRRGGEQAASLLSGVYREAFRDK